ncbi:MAG: membrane protein insertase YidC [Alphaproteobacteria bacterium]|nr:membrane protein insertase YidC [Alphaproteobacteria bacterium]
MQQFDQKNLILAIAIAIAMVLGFELLWNQPRVAQQRAEAERRAASEQVQPQAAANAPAIPGSKAAELVAQPNPDRSSVIARESRVKIDTPTTAGSIALRGARLDDLVLKKYRETVDPDSPPVVLLSPQGTTNPYFADLGWVAASGTSALPGPDTLWTADRDTLTPGNPVTLSWDNGQGLRFERRISIEDEYFFRVDETVSNTGAQPVSLFGYALASRVGTPHLGGYYILHEGPIGVVKDVLKEPQYKDLREKHEVKESAKGGWLGFVDKYWLVALVPDQSAETTSRFMHTDAGGVDRYQVDYLGAAQSVAPGASARQSMRIFAGAKEVRLLDAYRERYDIPLFDRAIDFGWFYFLTKPMFLSLEWLYGKLGNFGISIIVLTMLVKLLFFPLANKSYKSMAKMKQLQPEMEALKAKYGEDRQRMSQEMMLLYKKSGANPLSGCLPIVIQIPVFFSLYKVLFVTIEMRHAPFFGWIQDLSAHDPTTVFNLFGLVHWVPPAFLPALGIWPLIMGVTMFLQQKLNPQPVDPVQAKMFMALPVVFTFMLSSFPSGLVIYWSVNNTLSILQQWVIMRRAGTHHPPHAKAKA